MKYLLLLVIIPTVLVVFMYFQGLAKGNSPMDKPLWMSEPGGNFIILLSAVALLISLYFMITL